MHKLVHTLEIETFCYPTEDLEKVKKAFELTGFEPSIDSVNGTKVLKTEQEKHGEITDFLKKVKSELPENDVKEICETIDRRTDEQGNFFFRLDKQAASEQEYKLSDGSDIHVRMKVSSFPSSREKAIEKLEKIWCKNELL